MESKSLEVYSEAINSGIVRMPDRQFPGVVIQGDSLAILYMEALDLVEALSKDRNSEAFATAVMMAERLEGHLDHYVSVIKKAGFRVPFAERPDLRVANFISKDGDA